MCPLPLPDAGAGSATPPDDSTGRSLGAIVEKVPFEKLEALRARLREYGSCLIAYSGGVDSVFLAVVAHQTLGNRALAVIADSPSLPRQELAEALELGRRFGFPVRVVHTREFENPRYLANPLDRCYFCKTELFDVLGPVARNEGYAVIAYGENASDIGDWRPGARAAAEHQVRAPLKEVGLTKQEIRFLSAHMGLPTADKPQMACLSSRIPYGEPVTLEKLRMIEAAEAALRSFGFRQVRVRHHELSKPVSNSEAQSVSKITLAATHPRPALARIELAAEELPRLLANGLTKKVAEAMKAIGYLHVTLDLEGYRRGSLNEVHRPTIETDGDAT